MIRCAFAVPNRQLMEPKAPSTRIGFVRFRFGSEVHKSNWSYTRVYTRFSFGSVAFSASENILSFTFSHFEFSCLHSTMRVIHSSIDGVDDRLTSYGGDRIDSTAVKFRAPDPSSCSNSVSRRVLHFTRNTRCSRCNRSRAFQSLHPSRRHDVNLRYGNNRALISANGVTSRFLSPTVCFSFSFAKLSGRLKSDLGAR